MESPPYVIEIATSDFATTQSAVEGGASRIELCANLAEGGTTVSYGHLKKCREAFSLPIFPIIRPRGGDFLYTAEEFDIMLRDVQTCKDLGLDGVVLGLLNKDGSIDTARTAVLVNAAYPLSVTFHRAFDRCAEPFHALEELIEMGCERILTSGQQFTAPEGMALIAELNRAAADRIIIMPGSGVRKENIAMLRDITGCVEFHSSLRGTHPSAMEYQHPVFGQSADTNVNNAIDPAEVLALRDALSKN